MRHPVNLNRNSSHVKANNANFCTRDPPGILLQAKSGIKSRDPNLLSEPLAVELRENDPVYFLTNYRLVCLIR
jgi:hypothetical protein